MRRKTAGTSPACLTLRKTWATLAWTSQTNPRFSTRSAWDAYKADYNKYVSEIKKSKLLVSNLFTLKNLLALPELLHDIRTSTMVGGLD
jgi:hypothetical protein